VNMLFKIQRNNPCPCDSGKKYKRCCLQTKDKPLFDESMDMNIVDFLEPHEYCDGYEELGDEDRYNLERLEYSDVSQLSDEAVLSGIATLKQLRIKYPRVPLILVCLQKYYLKINDQENKEYVFQDMVSGFPDYLFSRVFRAWRLIDECKYEEAFDILGRCNSLRTLYPKRKTFMVKELFSFHGVLAVYYAESINRKFAEWHYNFLVKLAASTRDSYLNGDPMLQLAREALNQLTIKEVISSWHVCDDSCTSC
jgi:hypothetical protein